MKWQSSITKSLVVTLTVLVQVAPSQGAPHHQLLYYNHVIPAQQRQSANVVIVPGNGAGVQQFAAAGVPLPVGGQYVLLQQPGANPVLYVARADGDNKPDGSDEGSGGSGGGFVDSIYNFITGIPSNLPSLPSIPGISGSTEMPGESPAEATTTAKPDSDKPEKPLKVVEAGSQQQSASLEKFDEDAPNPARPVAPVLPALVPTPGQRFVVIGQPQFYGNYDALRNHAVRQGLGTNGAVSSYLLLKNQQIVPLAYAANGKLQEEASNSVAHTPGASALEFQRYINEVKQQQAQRDAAVPHGYQNLVYVARPQPQPQAQAQYVDDSASITVEALKVKPHAVREEESEDTDNVEANSPGPSVAQVKPQAIALAGPGGVAAAAPIGTALVGPGGLAVAAPSATAVAGPSGGAPPPPGAQASTALSSPAAYKAYLLEQQSRGVYPGSYHVAYNA